MNPEKKDPFEQLLKTHLSASLSRSPAESCPDENWMAAYLEGSQSEPFKKTFERHLLQCDRCQAEMALLLKTSVTEGQQKPLAVPAASSPRSNLLSLLVGWTRATAFRPVFAILVVSVVTGVVGYQLLRDKQILQLRPVETAEPTSGNSSPLAHADEPSAAPSVDDHKPQEEKQRLKSESSPVRREAAQDRLEAARASQAQPGDLRSRGRTNSQDSKVKDAFAAEPPSTVPAESNRDAVAGPKRRDMAVASQTSPEPLQKESRSGAAIDRQNSQLQTKADEASAKPKNQVMPAAAPPPARPALGALSEKKAEQDNLADAKEARAVGASVKKKQVLVEGTRQAGAYAAVEANAVSRIEVGGKRFDLSDGVWKDASILPDDPRPTRVKVNSPDFEGHRKQLVPYQEVISRPEDVLIKLHNQVYRIQKAPK